MADLHHLYVYSYRNPHTQDVIRGLITHLIVEDPSALIRFKSVLLATLHQDCHESCDFSEVSKVADWIYEDVVYVMTEMVKPPKERLFEVFDYIKYIFNTCEALQTIEMNEVNIVENNYGGNVGGRNNIVD